MTVTYPKYEEDFYGWTQANAQLLRERKLSELDFENLIEEVESMGRSEKSQLTNRLSVLIAHLLKWQYQSDLRQKEKKCERSWQATIEEQRDRVVRLIKENPSLKNRLEEVFEESFKYSLLQIKKETPIDLDSLPSTCPYTFEECLDDSFYPESHH